MALIHLSLAQVFLYLTQASIYLTQASIYLTQASIYLTQTSMYIGQVGAEQFINTGKVIYHYTNGTVIRLSLFKAGYGPNGVLTSFHKFLEISDIVLFTFLCGSGLASIFLAYLLYGGEREGGADTADSTSEDEATDEATDEAAGTEEEGMKYEGQYFKQLEELPEKELTPEELAVISQHVLIEETPKGPVYMSYNPDTQTFVYYTDKFVDVTYEILDTVARLFAITFCCKQVCVNYREQVWKGEQNMLTEIEFDKLKKELDERNLVNNSSKERSVFASFKSYNKKNGNNVEKKYYIVTEKANRFKYKGKISDYEKQQKQTSEESLLSCINITYSEFKRLQELAQAKAQVQEQVQVQAQVQEQVQVQAQVQAQVEVQEQAETQL